MTRATWFYALAGMVIFACLLLVIPIDIGLLVSGQETVSRWHMLTGRAHPVWFPSLCLTVVLLPIGMFLAHYFSPGNVDFWETAELWAPPIILAPVILFAGVLLGRWLVAQTL